MPAIQIGPTKKGEGRDKFMWKTVCSFGNVPLEIVCNNHLRFRCRESGKVKGESDY